MIGEHVYYIVPPAVTATTGYPFRQYVVGGQPCDENNNNNNENNGVRVGVRVRVQGRVAVVVVVNVMIARGDRGVRRRRRVTDYRDDGDRRTTHIWSAVRARKETRRRGTHTRGGFRGHGARREGDRGFGGGKRLELKGWKRRRVEWKSVRPGDGRTVVRRRDDEATTANEKKTKWK